MAEVVSTTCLEVSFAPTGVGSQFVYYPLTGEVFRANCRYEVRFWLKRTSATAVPVALYVGRSDDYESRTVTPDDEWVEHVFLWTSDSEGTGAWLAVGIEGTAQALTLRVAGVSVKRYWPSQIGPIVSGIFAPNQEYLVGVTRMVDEP